MLALFQASLRRVILANVEKKKKRKSKSDLGSSATTEQESPVSESIPDQHANLNDTELKDSQSLVEPDPLDDPESPKDCDLGGSELLQKEEINETQESLNEPQFFKRNKSTDSVHTEDEWTVIEKPKQLRIISAQKQEQPKSAIPARPVKQEITKKQRENQQKALKLKLMKQEQEE
ncbi:hypothetical protein HDV06_001042 [Boothiomyces sp. JEL0866]|nr:hypothetical protein HDV06_001042 [Boothiomyces sp. JEL0866]